MKICEQLKSLRKTQGMTLEEVARRCNILPANISSIENGRVSPTAETIERLADAMDSRVLILPKSLLI